MKTIIVMVMHGVPPNDFPRQELAEFFTLQGRLRRDPGPDKALIMERHSSLADKIRSWPRTPQNDPFHAGSQELAEHLSRQTGYTVLVGYNEFCAPNVNEALEEAARKQAQRIVVVTSMMTRGGEHAEVEIPSLVQSFQTHHPEIETVYAWPFAANTVAQFLAEHISKFV